MIAVIIKGFAGHKPGELVETAGWRNEAALLRARTVRPASVSECELFKKGTRSIHLEKPGKPGQKTAAA